MRQESRGLEGAGDGRSRASSSAVLFLVTTAIWGSTWYVIKLQLGVVPVEASVTYRFLVAGVALAGWCLCTGRSLAFPRREHLFMATHGALMFGMNYVAVYYSESFIPSGLVAIVFSTVVFMTPLAMRVAYAVPLRPSVFAAAGLGVAGVALLFVPELELNRPVGRIGLGVLFALLATGFVAWGNVVATRNHRQSLPVLPSTAIAMLYGAVWSGFLGVALGVEWTFEPTPRYLVSLLYLAIPGSVVAFVTYFHLIARVGASSSAFIGVSTPVIAMILSAVLEEYAWTGWATAGVALAVAGNLYALRVNRTIR